MYHSRRSETPGLCVEGIDGLFPNDEAERSGLQELGGRIGNGLDQSLRLTAPPAVLYPVRGAIRWPPCTPKARCSSNDMAGHTMQGKRAVRAWTVADLELNPRPTPDES